MSAPSPSPAERVASLIRVRQFREFTAESPSPAELHAIGEVARWSGSSSNQQPWRFVTVRAVDTLRRIAVAGAPQTRSLETAPSAIAIVLPDEPGHRLLHAYDEGRAAERIFIAASLLGLGAGISWIRDDVRDAVREILGLPPDRFVRTVVALGHPTEAARRPKSAPGQARRPRAEMVFEDRWPAS